jgi:hypothetical protein
MKSRKSMKRAPFVAFGLLFLSLGLVFVPPPVWGQEYQTFRWERENIETRTRFQFGPFRLYPLIRFREIGYDNNVYRERETDDPIPDFTATFSPEAQVFVLYKDWLILRLRENPEYVFFAKEARERSLNNRFSLGYKLHLFNRLVFSGDFIFNRTRVRATSEFDVRANQILIRYEGSLFYETPRETCFGIKSSIQGYNYEDELIPGEEVYYSRVLNRTEVDIFGEFYYKLRQDTFFFAYAGYTSYEFRYIEAKVKNSYSWEGMAGVRFPILGTIRGSLSLGYKQLIPRTGNQKHFYGPIGNVGLETRIKRFNIRAQFNKDVEFSYWTNNIFFVEYRYGGGLSFYLSRSIRLDYDLYMGNNRYPEEREIRYPDESYEIIQRADKYASHEIGIVFRVIRNTGLGLTLNIWERSSNDYWYGKRRSAFLGGYITYDF